MGCFWWWSVLFSLPLLSILSIYVFFFLQAEDGIRDHCVTGVQTCALPISTDSLGPLIFDLLRGGAVQIFAVDRKSTRLNSSHTVISYAVFCLKKKKKK